jgi:hypothetical protein
MVVIFGTFHSGKKDTPEYAERLRLVLKEIGPDVICAELSPEQLSGEVSCKSKPEYPDVILPFAEEHATPVVPIQPDTEAGLKLEQEMARIVRESTAGAAARAMWEYSEYLDEAASDGWREVLQDSTGIENVQLRAFDLLAMKPGWDATRKYFPEVALQWEAWNEHFLGRIEAAIHEHAGRCILLTTGLAHKYWLWERLRERSDVELHNLRSFREVRERRPT